LYFQLIPVNRIASVTSLTHLSLANNALRGAIPTQIGLLTNLKVLDLSNNQLTSLPSEIARLTALETLNLGKNQFSQPLPYMPEGLTELRLPIASFVGSLPVQTLPDLEFLVCLIVGLVSSGRRLIIIFLSQ
jgi:hypothetical protein